MQGPLYCILDIFKAQNISDMIILNMSMCTLQQIVSGMA